ncbi:hypothetical protein KVT40_006798 [Elsinoe batatas]|uniref:Uncharacterized protein n=1 Tax=Elsinoe batatas TaxID=2601811 RepID=A0A8K0KWY5_9PEZI|nr:hypothetical protein KVT40_006798 [Elsinoe batatas]
MRSSSTAIPYFLRYGYNLRKANKDDDLLAFLLQEKLPIIENEKHLSMRRRLLQHSIELHRQNNAMPVDYMAPGFKPVKYQYDIAKFEFLFVLNDIAFKDRQDWEGMERIYQLNRRMIREQFNNEHAIELVQPLRHEHSFAQQPYNPQQHQDARPSFQATNMRMPDLAPPRYPPQPGSLYQQPDPSPRPIQADPILRNPGSRVLPVPAESLHLAYIDHAFMVSDPSAATATLPQPIVPSSGGPVQPITTWKSSEVRSSDAISTELAQETGHSRDRPTRQPASLPPGRDGNFRPFC